MHKRVFCNSAKILFAIFPVILLSACSVSLKHVPSPNLSKVSTSMERSINIMVADIGDDRDEPPNKIGQGVSYWLPISYSAKDNRGLDLPVSYYIAKSLCEDIERIGYKSKLANDSKELNDKLRQPLTVDDVMRMTANNSRRWNGLASLGYVSRQPLTVDAAIAAAKKEKMDYLVTTELIDGKTNFWGFIVIPFAEPVWTRIAIDSRLYDLNSGESIPIQTNKKETEWYFGKLLVCDTIWDAGLFGKHWHQTAWGETVVSEALAEIANNIAKEIQTKQQAGTVGSIAKDLK